MKDRLSDPPQDLVAFRRGSNLDKRVWAVPWYWVNDLLKFGRHDEAKSSHLNVWHRGVGVITRAWSPNLTIVKTGVAISPGTLNKRTRIPGQIRDIL